MSLQVDQQCKLLQETAPYPVTNQGADMGCLSMGRVLNEVIGVRGYCYWSLKPHHASNHLHN